MVPRFNIRAYCLLLALSGPVYPQGTSGEPVGMTLVELLEFIGEFTTEDGRWLSPDDFLVDDVADTEAGAAIDREQADEDAPVARTGRTSNTGSTGNASVTNASE